MKYLHDFNTYLILNEAVSVEPIEAEQYANETVPNLPFNGDIKDGKEDFLKKLTYVCKQINCKPEWMMINIAGESGFKPDAVNPNGGATGLIQFMPKTISGYANPETHQPMTTDDLKKMSAVQQLDVVQAYYKECMKEIGISGFNKPGDFFGITFFPKIVKEGDDYQFPQNAVDQNKALFAKIGGTTKKAYYDYCDRLVNGPVAMKNSISNFDQEGFFGAKSGANKDFFQSMVDELGGLVGNILSSNPGIADDKGDKPAAKPETKLA